MTQEQIVRAHLIKHGSITAVEAQTVYKIRWVATRIKALRDSGMVIESVQKRDATGQRYVRYELKSMAKPNLLPVVTNPVVDFTRTLFRNTAALAA